MTQLHLDPIEINSHVPMTRRSLLLLLFSLLITLAACGPKKPAGPVHRYAMEGTIVSIDQASHQVMVNMKAIPGFMEAMVMPMTLKADWAYQVMKPGQTIKATLVVQGDQSWLEHPTFSDTAAAPAGTETGSTGPAPGAHVPDFTLRDQSGHKLSLASLKGKAVVLTFIYTRCPLPNYCPLMERNFRTIHQQVQKNPQQYPPVDLISFSFDPQYDTPSVLKKYGERYVGKEGFAHWQFATSTPKQIATMAKYFGVAYQPEQGVIVHTLQTVVIDPEGRFFKSYYGNEWDPQQVLTDLQRIHQVNAAAGK